MNRIYLFPPRLSRLFFICCIVILLTAYSQDSFAACNFVTVSGVGFGAYDVFSATADDSTGSMRIRCAPRANVLITLSTGQSGIYSTRTLQSSLNILNYNLYTNSTRTTIWGDGTGGSSTVSLTNIANSTVILYGRIPALQDAAVGAYTDNVTITITF